jgi:hypothetical protein
VEILLRNPWRGARLTRPLPCEEGGGQHLRFVMVGISNSRRRGREETAAAAEIIGGRVEAVRVVRGGGGGVGRQISTDGDGDTS